MRTSTAAAFVVGFAALECAAAMQPLAYPPLVARRVPTVPLSSGVMTAPWAEPQPVAGQLQAGTLNGGLYAASARDVLPFAVRPRPPTTLRGGRTVYYNTAPDVLTYHPAQPW